MDIDERVTLLDSILESSTEYSIIATLEREARNGDAARVATLLRLLDELVKVAVPKTAPK